MLEVAVQWGPLSAPLLNKGHHVTVCRCPIPEAAAALAARLQARAAPWLCEKGVLRGQLAREVSLCRTARKLDGMETLLGALREEIAREAGL